MPYSLIFDHAMKPSESEDRFKTTAMLTIMQKPNVPIEENRTLSRQKSKQVIQDINQAYIKTTESRNSAAHVIYTPADTSVSANSTADLPDFKR